MIEVILEWIRDPNKILFLLGILIGFNTGYNFSDFDEWIRSKIPDDFKSTFTYYLIDKLLKIIHHYMLGLAIVILYYPPTSWFRLICVGFGLGLFIEETDVFIKDVKRVLEKLKKLKELRV